LPNDPFFEEMDPMVKLWLYESWSYEYEQKINQDRALGILIGSFTNPEAAKKLSGKLNPQFSVEEEEVDKIMEEIAKDDKLTKKQKVRKKRRK